MIDFLLHGPCQGIEIRSKLDLERTEMEIIPKDDVHFGRRAHEVVHMGNGWTGDIVRQPPDIVNILGRQHQHVRVGSPKLKDFILVLPSRERSAILCGYDMLATYGSITLVQDLFCMPKESEVGDHDRFPE